MGLQTASMPDAQMAICAKFMHIAVHKYCQVIVSFDLFKVVLKHLLKILTLALLAFCD